MSTRQPGQRRWPLHPRPGPVEALSSWLQRVAQTYGLSVTDLLGHNLGSASAQVTDSVLADLDFDPPALVLAALAERTGVGLAELRMMTIAGWVPCLTDTLVVLDSDGDQELFDTYVRQHSVLLASGEAGRNTVHRWWRGPWLAATHPRSERRVCPVCAADPQCGTALIWRVPITLSCMEHTCRLEPAVDVELAALEGLPMAPAPVGEHVAAMDRRTHEGLTIRGLVSYHRALGEPTDHLGPPDSTSPHIIGHCQHATVSYHRRLVAHPSDLTVVHRNSERNAR